MKKIDMIDRFKEQSTWRLLGLGVITYGIYFAYYIKRQTQKINSSLEESEKISDGFVGAIIIISYISLILFVGYMVVDEGHPIKAITNGFDRVLGISFLLWAFKARSRVNSIFEITKDDQEWFHGLWTFVFSFLYFNYKVNQICSRKEFEIKRRNNQKNSQQMMDEKTNEEFKRKRRSNQKDPQQKKKNSLSRYDRRNKER